MSDWEEGSSSPEAGQQAFHEAITPVQSSPSDSEEDDDDFNPSIADGVQAGAGSEKDESSSDEEDRAVNQRHESEGEKQARKSAFNYADAEDSAFHDEDKFQSAESSGGGELVGGSGRHGDHAFLRDGSSGGEEKDGDSSADDAADPSDGEAHSAVRKRRLDSNSEDEDDEQLKKSRTADEEEGDSDHGSAGEESPQAELTGQQVEERSVQPEANSDSEGDGSSQAPMTALQELQQQQQEEEDDSDGVVDEGKSSTFVSDFDLMMQRRREAMSRARKRRRKDIYLTSADEQVVALIREMKLAAEEDCRLNIARKAAVKKLQMLSDVVSNLKKADLLQTFIECGICSALADWLQPLPDHSLPHLKIRDSILDILKTFPDLDSTLLKTSNLGKAVMRLYRHPKETKKNRDKAGKLINNWARPIFGLATNFKALSRQEREERDYEHLSQAARRRLSSGGESSRKALEEEDEPAKPGDKGWIGRARVPMPSNKDYVVRPAWKVMEQGRQRGSTKKPPNRYEKHIRSQKAKKTSSRATHAISISVEGRQMPL